MKKFYFVAFILAFIILFLPFFFRGESSMPSNEFYYHSTVGDEVSFFSGERYIWEPLHVFKFLDDSSPSLFDDLLRYSGLFFSFFSFIIFFFIVRKIFPRESFWILLVFALSPPLMASSFVGPRESFALFFLLLGWLFFEYKLPVLSVISFIVPALSGFPALFSTIGLVLILFFRKRYRIFYVLLSFCGLVLFFIPKPPSFIQPSFNAFFSDLGGLYGVGAFLCVLFLIGIFVFWQIKSKQYFVFAVSSSLILLCFVFSEMLVFINVLLCILAGFAINWLYSRKWVFPFLQRVSILTIICGMLFSAIVHAHLLAELPPDDDLFNSVSIPPSMILTHENYGFWLQYAGHSVIADILTYKQPDGRSRLHNLEAVFNTNVLRDVVDYTDHYGVSHIMVSEEMTNGLVWPKKQVGLHNLVNNRETFKMLNDDSNYTLWVLR